MHRGGVFALRVLGFTNGVICAIDSLTMSARGAA
jgi:hypothetical protein